MWADCGRAPRGLSAGGTIAQPVMLGRPKIVGWLAIGAGLVLSAAQRKGRPMYDLIVAVGAFLGFILVVTLLGLVQTA